LDANSIKMKINYLVIITTVLFLSGCEKDKDFFKSLPSCSSDLLFTHSPIAPENILRFIPLGHYNPSGHVFPTSHHYIDIKRGKGSIPVYSPCDGWIGFITENQLPSPLNVEYSLELWACKDVMIKYGHLSRLDGHILNQLGKVVATETYSTGGSTYNLKIYRPRIQVKAGDKIGELLDMDGITGIDFGTIDKRKKLPLIKPERWNNYGYVNAVSFLNYTTTEIRNAFLNISQYGNEGYLQRKTPPLEGQICYDVEGSAQGIWFMPGKDVTPEDPHMSLIRNNFYPQKNVFSMGTSVPGLLPIAYEFYPVETGTHNRSFDKITADGQIFTFSDFSNIWEQPLTDYTFPSENVILIQLLDKETLRIEKQTIADGPPWSFKTSYRDFKR
jgi:hypothetical protein